MTLLRLTDGDGGVTRDMYGLTLLELLVALAVGATLTAIGVPAMTTMLQHMRAMSTYHAVTTSMASARMASIAHNVPVAVCPSVDGLRCRSDGVWDSGWIIFFDASRNGQPQGPSSILQRSDALPPNSHVHSTSGRRLVRYRADGTAAGTNVSLRVCVGDRLFGTVVINNPGRARTSRENPRPACPFTLD